MAIQGYSRISADMYLKHKEHFDSGLISLLERKEKQLCKYKQREVIYKATIS